MIRRRIAGLARLSLVASLLVGLPLVSGSASAADSTMGQDEVTLKDGGTVRGTIVSSQPGVSVKIIELGETQSRTIRWAEIGNVERGKYAPKANGHHGAVGGVVGGVVAAPAAPPPAPPPSPAAGPPSQSAVRLHVDSPVPALVYSHETAYGAVNGYGFVVDAASPVCSSPCDKVLDGSSGQTYTAGGDFTTSPPFTLIGQHGDVELSVEPGNHKLRVAGYWLTYSGVILTVLGGTLALTGALLPSTNTTFNADGSTGTTDAGFGWMTPTGLVVAGGGVAMIVGGVVALVGSKTKIDLHPMPIGPGSGIQAAAVKPRYWMGEF
jgi:hypothetical protein